MKTKQPTAYNLSHRFISREQAEQMLGRVHPSNRAPAEATVRRYAQQMQAGEWDANNPQPIMLSSGPVEWVLDGTHRLTALTRTTLPGLRFWVASGVDPRTMLVADQGRPRSSVDILRIHAGENVSRDAASVLRCVVQMPKSNEKLTSAALCAAWDCYAEPVEWAATMIRRHRHRGISTATSLAAFVRASLHGIDQDSLEAWYRAFCDQTTGDDTPHVVGRLLRGRLSGGYGGGSVATLTYLLVAKGIMLCVAGEAPSKLVVPASDPLPLPRGDTP